jgi:hypothetical protein
MTEAGPTTGSASAWQGPEEAGAESAGTVLLAGAANLLIAVA